MTNRRERFREQRGNYSNGNNQPVYEVPQDLIHEIQKAESGYSSNALTIGTSGTELAIGRVRATETHLVIPENITVGELKELGVILAKMEGSVAWYIGDWANAHIPDDAQGNQYAVSAIYEAICEGLPLEPGTVKNYAFTARQYSALIRINALSFTHHRTVESRDDRMDILRWAEQAGASISRMKEYMKALDLVKGRVDADELLAEFEAQNMKYTEFRQYIWDIDSDDDYSDLQPLSFQKDTTPSQRYGGNPPTNPLPRASNRFDAPASNGASQPITPVPPDKSPVTGNAYVSHDIHERYQNSVLSEQAFALVGALKWLLRLNNPTLERELERLQQVTIQEVRDGFYGEDVHGAMQDLFSAVGSTLRTLLENDFADALNEIKEAAE